MTFFHVGSPLGSCFGKRRIQQGPELVLGTGEAGVQAILRVLEPPVTALTKADMSTGEARAACRSEAPRTFSAMASTTDCINGPFRLVRQN